MIAQELGTELSRRFVNFKAMTAEECYKTPNPLSDKFIELTEYAMDHGVQVEKWHAGMLREMYRQRYGEQKVQELYESGKHWALTGGAAIDAYKANDYERCLRLATLSLSKAPGRDSKELELGYVVRALWRLKRYDEAIAQCRVGIAQFPEKTTFHHLFGVIASEKGGMDEEAYREAFRAVDINPEADGVRTAFEKLRKKLNKPEHPKVIANERPA
jgi:hypothetical protein